MKKKYVQYGCGLSAPVEWENYDVSPTLRIQKLPALGKLLRGRLNTQFPQNVMYGDIIQGLPVDPDSCDGVYCSHTLEHLSLNDFRKALVNTKRIMKPGGIFRCVVPDLEWYVKSYLEALQNGNVDASIQFMRSTSLGVQERPRGAKQVAASLVGNSSHLWMWDHTSFSEELRKTGFKEIRPCQFNDSADEMFKLVEDRNRFMKSVAIECKK